jgi:hypothetical protein
MDQAGFQQASAYSAPALFVYQHRDDQETISATAGDLYDFYSNNAGHSQIATNFLHRAIELEHSHAVFPGFEQSPGVDLSLNSASTECQYPANDQSFQQNVLPWPQLQSSSGNLVPQNDPNHAAISCFQQAHSADLTPGTQRLGGLKRSSRFERCIMCRALHKAVFFFTSWLVY